MKIGITGETGFIGTHLASRLIEDGHAVLAISRSSATETGANNREAVVASVTDEASLRAAFADCDRVAHLAGINLERDHQTFETVHVRGTKNVVNAATDADVSKVILSSFLRARPDCGSGYHESKWQAEEIVRHSGVDYTICKPGVVYGPGDQMLEHIARSLATVPVFGLVGLVPRWVRPLAIADLVDVLTAALTDDRLSKTTVPIMGPEAITLKALVRRVGEVIDYTPAMIRVPVSFHYAFAWAQEQVMERPITTMAQVRMLAEGVSEPAPKRVCDSLPDDLLPTRPFSIERIASELATPEPYGLGDLRWSSS